MLPKKHLIVGLLLVTSLFLNASSVVHFPGNSIQKIFIDAGHGGKDPGTGGGREKEYALDIALRLGNKIKASMKDVEVIYTRDKDIFIPLNERADIANRNKADLFISIHCNAFTSSSASGTETYVMGLHKTEANLDLAKRENNVILMEDNYSKSYKGFNPNSPLAHIMLANYQSAFMNQSMDFASRVENQFVSHGHKSRGVKQAGFLVIWETTMPSVLIETGYLSNPTDAKKLSTDSGRENIAQAIYKALYSYKSDVERNQ
jgi:N-acetylmuramoyl-L-alanine amidase